jgi:hypothetical protein
MRAKTTGILLAQVVRTVSHSFRRVRLIKWAFTHPHGDRIEYSVETHQAGLELRVTLNAELLHLQVFPPPTSWPGPLARAETVWKHAVGCTSPKEKRSPDVVCGRSLAASVRP